jgi:hypothetical protein
MRLVDGADGILLRKHSRRGRKACELGLEGVASKRAGSFYRSGPSRNRPKPKNPDFVRT